MGRFEKLKADVRGRLTPKVYAGLYKTGVECLSGNILEIGTATGASAIAIALGLKESGKQDSMITTIEKGHSSRSLRHKDDVEKNASMIQKNLSRYGVNDYVHSLMGDVEDVYHKVPDELVGMMIDADGALDRDFKFFHNSLVSGAFIILDDYEDKIKYDLVTRSDEALKRYEEKKGATIEKCCPLGKHYTTFRFCNYLMEKGVIKKDKVIGNTLFSKKGRYFTDGDMEEMKMIRRKIMKEFVEMRRFNQILVKD